MTKEQLEALSKEELVCAYLELQNELTKALESHVKNLESIMASKDDVISKLETIVAKDAE